MFDRADSFPLKMPGPNLFVSVWATSFSFFFFFGGGGGGGRGGLQLLDRPYSQSIKKRHKKKGLAGF